MITDLHRDDTCEGQLQRLLRCCDAAEVTHGAVVLRHQRPQEPSGINDQMAWELFASSSSTGAAAREHSGHVTLRKAASSAMDAESTWSLLGLTCGRSVVASSMRSCVKGKTCAGTVDELESITGCSLACTQTPG